MGLPKYQGFFMPRRKGGILMGYYSDPTAARAIGAADRELRRMIMLAYRYHTEPAFAERIREPEWVFRGVFRRLLTETPAGLKEMLHPKHHVGL